MPRRNDKWIFSSHWGNGRFADNSKYLFFSVLQKHPDVNAIWITGSKDTLHDLRNHNLPCAYKYSIRGIYHCLTSKVWVTTWGIEDINRCFSGGAFFCNLWHGVSLKKVWWLAPEKAMKEWGFETYEELHDTFISKILNFSILFRRPDMVLVPSEFQAETFFYKMFDIPQEHLCLAGYPRNLFAHTPKEKILEFIKQYEPEETLILTDKLRGYKRVYLYMPTWRNNGEDFISAANIDWKRMNEALKQSDSLLLLKLHPLTFNIDSDFQQLRQYDRILVYPNSCDIYTVLPFTTCLITDYSSIYSDYVLLEKEIILFTFDYDRYVKGSSEMKDYDKYFLGKRANSFNELLNIIHTGEDCHLSHDELGFVKKIYWNCAENGVDIANQIKQRIHL